MTKRPHFTKVFLPWDNLPIFKGMPVYSRFQSIQAALPKWCKEIHPQDLERVVLSLSETWHDIFSIEKSTSAITALRDEAASLAKDAKRLVDTLHDGAFMNLSEHFESPWLLAREVYLDDQAGTTKTYDLEQIASDSASEWEVFTAGLIAIGAASDIIETAYTRRFGAKKPHDNRRILIASNLAETWISMKLLTGQTLEGSLPTGRNGGLRWCFETHLLLNEIMLQKANAPTNSQMEEIYSQIDLVDVSEQLEPLKIYDPTSDVSLAIDSKEMNNRFQAKTWTYETFVKGISQSLTELSEYAISEFDLKRSDWSEVTIKQPFGLSIVSYCLNVGSDELAET